MAVMTLSQTLQADDRHGIDGTRRAAPIAEIEPLSPAWYIETIRRLLHAGRARESYQMPRLLPIVIPDPSMSGLLPPMPLLHPAVVSLPNAI